jgi:membrane associated rhomboid family serine protease
VAFSGPKAAVRCDCPSRGEASSKSKSREDPARSDEGLIMGFESRDYARDGSYTASLSAWGMDLTPVVKYLVAINVVVLLLQILRTRPAAPPLIDFDGVEPDHEQTATDTELPISKKNESKKDQKRKRDEQARKAREAMEQVMSRLPGMRASIVQEWFELNPRKTVQQAQIWRLVTSAFCHDRFEIWHILFNMLVLCWFGQRLERMYGPTEFLLFYLAATICASIASVALAYYNGSMAPAIGASGAIMGVMMLYVIYYPFEHFLLFWMILVPLWVLLGVYVGYDLHPVLLALAGDPMFTRVAHAGHLGGLAFGFAYWRFGWRLEPILDRVWPVVAARNRMQFREPAIPRFSQRGEDLAARVDEILTKISQQGTESLTDEERDILNKASAKYRSRG